MLPSCCVNKHLTNMHPIEKFYRQLRKDRTTTLAPDHVLRSFAVSHRKWLPGWPTKRARARPAVLHMPWPLRYSRPVSDFGRASVIGADNLLRYPEVGH